MLYKDIDSEIARIRLGQKIVTGWLKPGSTNEVNLTEKFRQAVIKEFERNPHPNVFSGICAELKLVLLDAFNRYKQKKLGMNF